MSIVPEEVVKHSIEGVVTFMRQENTKEQVCCCCPQGGGHIYARRVVWDEWDTKLPKHFGNGPTELVYSKICRDNAMEGVRIRVTVEVIGRALLKGGESDGRY